MGHGDQKKFGDLFGIEATSGIIILLVLFGSIYLISVLSDALIKVIHPWKIAFIEHTTHLPWFVLLICIIIVLGLLRLEILRMIRRFKSDIS